MEVSDVEEWRDTFIFGERYQVSNFGRVRSKSFIKTTRNMHTEIKYLAGNRILALTVNDGYYQVRLSFNKDKRTAKVHQLVARAFVDGYKEGLVVNHKNSNRQDNHYENLEWVTVQQNVIHGYVQGKATNKEENHPRAILNHVLVEEIARLRLQQKTLNQIAELTGLNYHTVWAVIRGRNWAESYQNALLKLKQEV